MDQSSPDYDSRPDTWEHIHQVRALLMRVVRDLTHRSEQHDQSKLRSPEVEVFDRVTPKLAALKYGSDEYRASLRDMGPALTHHYDHNDHHPEHYAHGIEDMTLMAVTEMVCDWIAASKRTEGGSALTSLEHNCERFEIPPALGRIIANTIQELDY